MMMKKYKRFIHTCKYFLIKVLFFGPRYYGRKLLDYLLAVLVLSQFFVLAVCFIVASALKIFVYYFICKFLFFLVALIIDCISFLIDFFRKK